MRPSALLRTGVASIAIALVVTSCSIHLPDIKMVGGAASPGAPGAAAPTGAEAATDTGAGAASAGGGDAPSAESAEGKQCLGQETDVGVAGDRILLGSTFATSGPVSNISGPILKGVKSYFNKVNEEGGIFGRRIELKWYDDGWDAQRGKGFIKRLVEQDKVFVLSVAPSSNGLDASRTYLEQKRVPVFGTSGLIESQFESPMQWPVGTSTKSISRISLQYMKQRKVSNLAVIWLDLLAGRQAMDAYLNGIKPIMGVAPEDFLVNTNGYRVSISEPDFGPVWARIQEDTRRWQSAHDKPVDGRPDFVSFAIDPTNAIKALQAAENIGFRPKIAWGGGPPLFLDLVPQSTQYAAQTGLLASTAYYPPIGEFLNRPAVKEYVETVKRYYGDDVDVKNPYLEGGYAGAAFTVEVLKRAGPCLTRDRAIKAADTMRDFSAAGLTPPMTFQSFGQGAGHYGNTRAMSVRVTKDGGWASETGFDQDPSPGAD